MKAKAKTLATFGYIVFLEAFALARGLLLRLGARERNRPDLDEWASRLRADGFVVLENYFTPEEVERITEVAESHMQEGMGDCDLLNRISYFRRPLADQPDDGGVFRLFGAQALHPAIEQFRRDDKLIGIIEKAFHTRLRCAATLIQENLPIGTETRGFHLDMYAPREFKAFLFLTDVTEDRQGPYALLRGSHRWRWRRLGNFLRRGLRDRHPVTSIEDLSAGELAALEKVHVRRGSVVLSIQQAIHRGWPLAAGKRLAVVNYYYEKLRPREPDFEEGRHLGYRYKAVRAPGHG